MGLALGLDQRFQHQEEFLGQHCSVPFPGISNQTILQSRDFRPSSWKRENGFFG
jgi:hypothetical protein